jgi:LPXTG-motif cell wall-anchored protein
VPRPAFHFSKQEDKQKVRQTLSRGTIVAAAATSLLSLYTAAAFADADANGATEMSPGVLSGNNVQVPVHSPVNLCGNSVDVVGLLNPAFGNLCLNDDSDSSGSDVAQSAAYADAVDSPGVLSGNNVQVPLSVPLNACGNTVDVIGGLNPTTGIACGNADAASSVAVDVPAEEAVPPAPEVPDAVVPAVPDTVTPAVPEVVTPAVPEVVVPAVPDPVTPAVPAGEDDTPATEVVVPRTDDSVGSPSTPLPEAAPETETEFTTPVMDDAPLVERAPTLAHTGSEDMVAASAAGAALLLGGAILYRRGRVAARR